MVTNRLLGHAAIYTFSNFAVAGVPFLLLPVLTRVLDPAAYGLVAMFSLVVAFMSVGVGLNVHGAITVRCLDKSNFEIPTYVSTALCILVISTGLMFALVFIAGAMISKFTSIPVEWLYGAVLVAFLQFLVQILLVLFQAFRKPIKYGALRVSHALLDAIGSIVLVVVMALSWQGRLSGMIAAWLCAAIVSIYFLIREGWLARSIDSAYAKDALSYGVPLVPHAVGGVLLGMADRFMVNNILDVSSTGVYVVAVQLGLVLGMVSDSFNKAFAPWLMEKLSNINFESQNKIVIFTYAYFVAIISLAGFGAIITPYILPFIIGSQFQAASSLVVYMLFGNAFVGMYYMVTNYIFFSRKTGLLSILTIVIGGVSLGVSWILINSYGAEGAAIGFMFGQASLFLGAWILANFCVPMPWFKVFLPTVRR